MVGDPSHATQTEIRFAAPPRQTAYHSIVSPYARRDTRVPRSHPGAVPRLVFAHIRRGSEKPVYVAYSLARLNTVRTFWQFLSNPPKR
jgi:hypothetical protein